MAILTSYLRPQGLYPETRFFAAWAFLQAHPDSVHAEPSAVVSTGTSTSPLILATEAMRQLLYPKDVEFQTLTYFKIISAAQPSKTDDAFLSPEDAQGQQSLEAAPSPQHPPRAPFTFKRKQQRGKIGQEEHYETWRITQPTLIEQWRQLLSSPWLYGRDRCRQTPSGFRCPGMSACFYPGTALQFRSPSKTVTVLICIGWGVILVTAPGSRLFLSTSNGV